jgi:hypothetical protein
MADKDRKSAGMSYAPPLREFTEITEAGTSFDVRELAFYKERDNQRTFRSRAATLSVIFLMLATGILVANKNHNAAMEQNAKLMSALMENLDQTRLDQAQLTEMVESRLVAIEGNLQTPEEAPAAEDEEAAAAE